MHPDEIRGRMLAQFFFGELEKIAEANEVKGANPLIKEEVEDAPEEVIRTRSVDSVDTPGKIFGTEIQKKKDGSVKAFPIANAPDGFSFRPDLQTFVADPQQPGWVSSNQEALAEARRSGYTKAKQEEQLTNARREASMFLQNRLRTPEAIGGAPQGMPQPLQIPQQQLTNIRNQPMRG